MRMTEEQLASLLAGRASVGVGGGGTASPAPVKQSKPPPPPGPYDPEGVLRAWVVDKAERNGWLVYFLRDSRKANCAGFPDLVLVKPSPREFVPGSYPEDSRIFFVELKKYNGIISDAQQVWIDALQHCVTDARTEGLHVDVMVWKPEDLESIERILTK